MIQITIQEVQQKKILTPLPQNLPYKMEKYLEENLILSKTTALTIDRGDNLK